MAVSKPGLFPRMTTVEDVQTADPSRAQPFRAVIGWLGPISVVVALVVAIVTYAVLSGLTPIVTTDNVVNAFIAANSVAVLLLLAVIGREIWQMVQGRRHGQAGSRLHVRIVGLFSLIAAAPAIFVSVIASVTLDRGLDTLFSTHTRALIENSRSATDAYMSEHAEMLGGNTLAVAYDLARAKPIFEQDREKFRQILTTQAALRNMSAVMLIDKDQNLIEKSNLPMQQSFVPPPKHTIELTGEAEPQMALIPDANYVAAIIKLREFDDTYLYVTRLLNPRIVAQFKETQLSIAQYSSLESRRFIVQIYFALIYAIIALTVVLAALWVGINFANRLVAPIRRLIGAANSVSGGDLQVQVPISQSEGDLAQLGETFNKMTRELRTQRDDIMRARMLSDSRRRFTEAVLAGASAGVIGVGADGRISILNRSAEKLIGRSETEVLGQNLADVVPELADLVAPTSTAAAKPLQGQIALTRGGSERTVSVRVTTEQSADPTHGYVVTLDDISELVSAQRTSAWADVARRIAHEIKNPLTPIQLSAERLKRKYGSVIQHDRLVFEQCTDTIVRQVDDIKRMVDEFSRFARMPTPVMTPDDVADAVRQVVFLQRVGNADIDIDVEIAEDPMPARFDRRLISQALTNIIKNATEAISAVPADQLGRGRIHVSASREGENIIIDVVDNGIGLPKENRSRLMEPYVTTREKGTGLGLAIVGKILEEHGGRIVLRDASDKDPQARGAWVRLTFVAAPVNPEALRTEAAVSA